jgi:hypothetical protein
MSGTVVPPRQQASQLRRGNTETIRSFQNPVTHTTARPQLQPLYPVNELQDFSPADYLSQSPDLMSTPCASVTLYPTLERGELQTEDFSYLSTSRSDFTWPMSYSSSPPTSDVDLTITSTATGSVMSRSNTDDALSGMIDMLRIDSSNIFHCNYSVASDSTIINAYKVDDVAAQTFPQSSMSSFDENSVVSQFQTPLLNKQSFVSFPSQTKMKRLPSKESNISSLSSSSQRSQSRLSRRVSEQNAQNKARPLAPRRECHDDSSSTKAKIPEITEVTSDDGTIRHKAEIPRTTRQQPQRKTTFCQICDDHPQGFHGEHELRRHVERHHTTYRKDNTLTDGRRPAVPLSNCKACRNHKTYGANYDAAAHLRRAHFFPCKNKRGGRGKVAEGRGGMGGGEEPPMDELKNWMYEKLDINVAGNVLQSTSPELSQIGTDLFTEFNQFDDALSYNHLALSIPEESANSYYWNTTQFDDALSYNHLALSIPEESANSYYWNTTQFDDALSYNHPTLSIPEESANSYDWNTTQFGVDLVSESYQFTNSAGSVIESAKPLSRMKSDGLERRRYKPTGPLSVDAVAVPPETPRAEEERVLKELLLGKECSVCGEPTTDPRAVYGALTPSCTHKWSVVICREDLQTYLATRITPEDGRVSSSIPCWAPNCNAILRHHDIQQHANIQNFEAYDNALLQQAIHTSESFAECSTSGCRGGGWVDSTSNITYFVCGLCHRTTCIEHNGPYETHAGKPCPATAGRRAQTERERERREEDRASEELLKKTAQLGPCGHWVSKIDGCNHMTCACLSSLC